MSGALRARSARIHGVVCVHRASRSPRAAAQGSAAARTPHSLPLSLNLCAVAPPSRPGRSSCRPRRCAPWTPSACAACHAQPVAPAPAARAGDLCMRTPWGSRHACDPPRFVAAVPHPPREGHRAGRQRPVQQVSARPLLKPGLCWSCGRAVEAAGAWAPRISAGVARANPCPPAALPTWCADLRYACSLRHMQTQIVPPGFTRREPTCALAAGRRFTSERLALRGGRAAAARSSGGASLQVVPGQGLASTRALAPTPCRLATHLHRHSMTSSGARPSSTRAAGGPRTTTTCRWVPGVGDAPESRVFFEQSVRMAAAPHPSPACRRFSVVKPASALTWPRAVVCPPPARPQGAVARHDDKSFGMVRTEITCSNCG